MSYRYGSWRHRFYDSVLFPISVIVAGALAIFVFVVGAVAIDRHYSEAKCGTLRADSGFVTEWHEFNFFDYGCFVRVDGKLVPFSSVRAATSVSAETEVQ